MTRKDYELIAKAIKLKTEDIPKYGGGMILVKGVVDGIAVAMKMDNPNFNKDKFLAACGLD